MFHLEKQMMHLMNSKEIYINLRQINKINFYQQFLDQNLNFDVQIPLNSLNLMKIFKDLEMNTFNNLIKIDGKMEKNLLSA